MTRRSIVAVVGSLNIDLNLRVPTLPRPGETVLASERVGGPGGKGANQAVAAAATGGLVAMIGAVGSEDGHDTVASLGAREVDIEAVSLVAGVPTGIAVVVVDATGENLIVVEPGANQHLDHEDVARWVDVKQPDVVLAQLEIPVAVIGAAMAARPDGAVGVLNPAPMPDDPGDVVQLLASIDVVVPNRSELGRLAGRPEPASEGEVDACVAALGFDGAVVVTLGADGAMVYDRDGERHHLPPEPAEVVDTSGAGDVFCGVLAARLAVGDSLPDAARVANTAAARSTTFVGAQIPAGTRFG